MGETNLLKFDEISRRQLLASSAAACLLSTPTLAATSRNRSTPVVQTTNGPVRGLVEDGGIHVFRGLRYAAPPVGKLRFREPQPPAKWTKVFEAQSFANAAVQEAKQADMPKDETHGEDCLFLNVWAPAPAKTKKPVMVWLHGGGFSSGASSRPTYWGDHFARDGVVMVGVNHRLNVFGFTQLPDSWGPEYASSGVAGLLDIVAALRWVRDNIARFGGDPENVTIFGESGGGAKVSLLLSMPSAKGLFRKAIIQSGAALQATPRAYASSLGQSLTEVLGVLPGDVGALAAIDTQRIFDAQKAAVEKVKGREAKGFLITGFGPSIDGKELPGNPHSPQASALAADIPLIIGTNKDEATMFMMGNPDLPKTTDEAFEKHVAEAYPADAVEMASALREAFPGYSPGDLIVALGGLQMFWINSVILAERKAKQNAPVWMYRMDHELPTFGGRLKAGHATELSYVFGTYENIRDFVGPGDPPARMAMQMHPAWVAFARSGNPQTRFIPEWPKYDAASRATMIFNLASKVENDPLAKIRQIMSRNATI